MTRWSGPEEGANRGTAMDARITLCSHLDHAGSETPTGPAVAAVIEAIAAVAIDLSDLIADGPLAGITGRTRGVNRGREGREGQRHRSAHAVAGEG